MKLLDLIKTANHNLFRSKLRIFLTILAIFVGSFTIIMTSAINNGVNDFIDKQVESIGGDGFVEVFPSAMYDQVAGMLGGSSEKVSEYDEKTGAALSANITDSDIKAMRAVDGVNKMEIFHMLSTEWMRLVDPAGDESTQKYDVSLEYFPEDNVNVDLSAGRITNSNSSEYEIILNEDWVKAFNLANSDAAIGRTVEIAIKQPAKCYVVTNQNDCLATVQATVVGVQAPGVLTMDGDLHINQALDNKLYDLSIEGVPASTAAQNNYIAVGNIDPDKVEEIRTAFRDLGFDFITIDDEVGMIRAFFNIVLIVLDVFGGIALLAAAIGIINTLFMSVTERRREIGLMKALGMSNTKVFLSFSVEAILIGFWGSVFGIAISAIIGTIFNSIAADTFLADFPTFQLVQFQPLTLTIITLIIMVIAFIAGTAPALRAARENPIDALRSE